MYSFAVVQHVTEIFSEILAVTRAKLKPGANALFHVVVEDAAWKYECDWMEDRSLKGKMKLRYGLNYFSRTKNQVLERLCEGDLVVKQCFCASEIAPELQDDIRDQHIFLVQKDAENFGAPMTDRTSNGRIAQRQVI